MSFEEALPSLVGNWKSAKSFPGSYIVVPVLEVNRSCLDKQRVREAIDKFFPLDEQSADSMIHNNVLKKELGL